MDQLLSLFDRLQITYVNTNHPPFFTAEDGLEWHDRIHGLHCKTLFLKDKKDKLYLVVIPCDKRADLGGLEKIIGSARLSFARPELLLEKLKLTPGSVTPFGLIHDNPPSIQVIIDQAVMVADQVNFHPLRNDYTTTISSMDLIKFLNHTGHEPKILPCG